MQPTGRPHPGRASGPLHLLRRLRGWRPAVALVLLPGIMLTARAAPADPFPTVAAAYAVQVDGELRLAHAPDTPRAPASLAKLLTALVLLDGDDRGAWDGKRVLTVSRHAAAQRGARLGLRQGDRLRAGEALAAMLVASSNDACMALVEGAGGMTAVARRMNARAAALGMTRSRFEHPCGFDHPRQQTTARDLLRLADAAMASPWIRQLALLRGAEITLQDERALRFATTNLLLDRVDGTVGLKTGATARAGDCLIAVTERDGRRVTVVMLGSRDRWFGALALIDRAHAEPRTAAR